MKGLIASTVVVGAVALAVAPVAAADATAQFSSAVAAAGFDITEENQMAFLALGLAVCVDMFNGSTFRQATADAVEVGMDYASAKEFVSISVTNLCPRAGVGAVA